MKAKTYPRILSASLLALTFSLACNFAANLLAPAEPSPLPTWTPIPPAAQPGQPSLPQGGESLPTREAPSQPTSTPEIASPTPPPAASPVEGISCEAPVCVQPGSFLLARPIGPQGRNTLDPAARFGIYQRATRDANRGVSFLNSSGTPVLAAAGGVVVVAGDDSRNSYGSARGIYGNLVILEHSLGGFAGPVYTLYAHLSEVSVQVNDLVSSGQEIGKVGMSGSVPGSTLHFEVRLGENSYQAARNPELWLQPLADESGQPQGAIAGRIVDDDGRYLEVENIVIERLAGKGQPALDQFYVRTYSGESLVGQEPWQESFALGDLPAGEYQISFLYNGMQQMEVEVQAGQLTLVTFEIR
jgi:murein DD-endopeptidase MepM/ murein hydrolase activator NlpD